MDIKECYEKLIDVKMKQREVYIRAWFGDWEKVTLPLAIKFFKGLKDGACSLVTVKKHFDEHFKGITYDEMIKVVEEET